jgi:hypothetical protein
MIFKGIRSFMKWEDEECIPEAEGNVQWRTLMLGVP